ncbi:MAG: PfkB family carbohydrate kinase [Actinomycetota bacterium]
MRVAVVGHVEWVSFALVERVPRAGEIVNATHTWDEAAGGGAVAAVQLAKLAGECDLFTAFGHDDLGSRSALELSAQGLAVHAAIREAPTRRAVALIDRGNERTIVTLGERLEPKGSDPLPWDLLAEADVAYVTAGDPEAFEAARQARLLVVTSRALAPLAASGVIADAVVGSARDAAESYDARTLDHPPPLIVRTEGLHGGSWNQDDEHRRWRSPVPWTEGEDDGRPPAADDYGAGDSFAAALSYGLAAGMLLPDAIAFSARCGAACASGRGPYSAQLTHADLPS